MSRTTRERDVRDGLWEKLLVMAACVVAVSLAFFAARREFSHHSPDAAASTVQSVEAVQTTEQRSSDVAGVAATPVRKVKQKMQARVKPAAPTTAPARTSCDALRRVHDGTRAERQWFIDNCMFLSRRTPQPSIAQSRVLLQSAGFSLTDAPPRRSPLEAGATPPAWLPGEQAVGLATSWITHNSPVALTIDPAGCNAIWINGHWVVTCQVGLMGCTSSQCVASLSVCVFTSDPVIVPDLRC